MLTAVRGGVMEAHPPISKRTSECSRVLAVNVAMTARGCLLREQCSSAPLVPALFHTSVLLQLKCVQFLSLSSGGYKCSWERGSLGKPGKQRQERIIAGFRVGKFSSWQLRTNGR